jgi:hypothetical protein
MQLHRIIIISNQLEIKNGEKHPTTLCWLAYFSSLSPLTRPGVRDDLHIHGRIIWLAERAVVNLRKNKSGQVSSRWLREFYGVVALSLRARPVLSAGNFSGAE